MSPPTPPTDIYAPFYQAEPCNWYSKVLREHAIAPKCYGFCDDNASEQAVYSFGEGDNLIVTMSWDAEPARQAK